MSTLTIRIGTGCAALGLAGALAACTSTSSGTATSAASSASAAASSAVSSASSAASSAGSNTAAPPSGACTSGQPATSVSLNTLTGQNTVINFDPNFLTAVQTLNLTVGGSGKATVTNGSATFPITGGSFTFQQSGSPKFGGDVKHDGSGISLTGGPAKIEMTNFDIDPAGGKVFGDVTANGQSLGSHIALFTVDGSSAQPPQKCGSTVVEQGLKLTVAQAAADALNKAFNTTAVTANAAVGSATLTMAGS